ncbi:Fic family protein [Pseudochelatococcus lubricantis]|uniref:Fic family protein n=1 Tax=Pseudochelatococcus lubricantis TaxID=1538102 RepID=UPI0035E55955
MEGHLVFALKYEGLDLTVLRRLFLSMVPEPVTAFVRAKPTSAYARRLWFLHEWLLDTRLNIPDADRGSYVPVVDPKQQFATEGVLSPRHRVRDNLPGTPDFCPLVCRTERLQALVARGLKERAREAVAAVPKDVLSRAAAVLAFGFVYIHPFEDGNGRLHRYLIRHNSL